MKYILKFRIEMVPMMTLFVLLFFMIYMTVGQIIPMVFFDYGWTTGNLLDNSPKELLMESLNNIKTLPGMMNMLFSLIFIAIIVVWTKNRKI